MLYLIGLGIWDELDISLKGLETCKKSDKIYAELYTLNWGGSLEKLSEMIGKRITELPRSGMEEDSGKIINEAKNSTVAVLVPGDPLVATTHIHIIEEAKKQGIETKIIHSSSIFSAIAKTGLQIYKFGRVPTIVAPTKDYAPDSFYDIAAENKLIGLHTLILLDINMSAEEGITVLQGIEAKKKKGLINAKTKIIACSRLGSDDEKIIYKLPDEIKKEELPSPAILIIPGNLHFSEEEALLMWE